MRPFNG